MAATRSNHADLLAVGFRKVLFDNYNRYPSEYQNYYNVENSSRAFEEDTSLVGLGLVPEKPEGSAVTYDDPVAGNKKRFDHKAFALGFQVTHEMMQDDQYRKMAQMPAQLGKSLSYTVEIEGAKLLNNAFVSVNAEEQGADSGALCAVARTSPTGVANTNKGTAALSETSIEDALINISEWTDERGLRIVSRPTSLIIPRELQFIAKRVLGSSMLPGGATIDTGGGNIAGQDFQPNDINPIKGVIAPTVAQYLTDANDWFIRCDEIHSYWFWREQPTFDRDQHFETKNARFSTYARFSHGFSDWRGWYGSAVA